MTDAGDALREMAENRGLKLVTSRIRTPGRGDYGKFGLRDAKGKDVFGFGKGGLAASAAEIETYLRGDGASAWKGSVGKTKPRAQPAPAPPAPPAPKPKPAPRLVLRDAGPRDADAIAALIVGLGFEATPAEVRKRLPPLRKAGGHAIVADQGGVIGLLTASLMQVLHRQHPVGRISMMVVAAERRGQGIGAALVAEAEARLKAAGCTLVEVTSNRKLLRAHAFYEKLGYARTSHRFAKPLGE